MAHALNVGTRRLPPLFVDRAYCFVVTAILHALRRCSVEWLESDKTSCLASVMCSVQSQPFCVLLRASFFTNG